jgi:hypothetical protein
MRQILEEGDRFLSINLVRGLRGALQVDEVEEVVEEVEEVEAARDRIR